MDAMKRDADPQETREWLDALAGVLAVEGPDRAHFLIEQLIDEARQSGAYLPFSANTAYINTIPTDAQVRIPGDQEIEHRIRSYVRWNAMAMVLRANKHTNVGGHIASFASAATLYDVGFNHFWRAHVRRARRRSRVFPGPLGHRRLRARLHAGPVHRGAARQLPAGSRRQGHLVVSASVADARFLAVPYGVDGPRPADGDLPGAVHEIPAGPRARADRGTQGVGVHGRRRNGRARVDGRHRHGVAREPRQPDLRRQLQPAASRRPGPRQRQDHPGAGERFPRRRLERHQARLGHALGCAARPRQEGHPDEADDGVRRRRVPDVQEQERRVRPRVFLQYAGAEGARARLVRRGDLASEPRRPRPVQDLRGVPHGRQSPGPADGDPRQDDQGLRDGHVRRGAEHHAPAEEDVARVAEALPRPLRDSRARRQARGDSVRQFPRGLAGAPIHARAPDGTGRLHAARGAANRSRWSCPSSRRSSGS